MTLGSPLGVIVNEYVVFHCQFEVGDLLTYPPRESRHIKSSWDRTADTVTYCLCECGSWLRETKGDLPNGLDDFMSSIMMFILKTERDKILNTSQYKPLNSTALQTIASKTRPAGYRKKKRHCNIFYVYFTFNLVNIVLKWSSWDTSRICTSYFLNMEITNKQ